MTGLQLREAQRMLGMTNQEICKQLGIAETTWCNWLAGRTRIPQAVVLAIKYMRLNRA